MKFSYKHTTNTLMHPTDFSTAVCVYMFLYFILGYSIIQLAEDSGTISGHFGMYSSNLYDLIGYGACYLFCLRVAQIQFYN